MAVLVFLVAVLWDRQVFREWTIPWNTTPAAALVWTVLAIGAAWLRGQRHPLLLGALAGLVPLFRPTEAVPVAVILLWLLLADWRGGVLRWPVLLRTAIAAGVVVLLQVGLHLLIYGPVLSDYQRVSRELGFTVYDFGWKAYVLLADPYPWFTDGQGLLARLPWVALAFAGVVPALWRGGPAGMIAAALIAHLVLYVSYLDLLPTGLWRYNNIHYWKWAIPGYGLLAYLWLRDLVRFRLSRPACPALAGLAAVALLALLRIAPQPAQPGQAAKMIQFTGPAPGFSDSYFGNFDLIDAAGSLRNVPDMRAIPVPGGMRVIGLRRDFVGEIHVGNPDHLAPDLFPAAPERWSERVVIGRPCWLRLAFCGKRDPDPLLPPPP